MPRSWGSRQKRVVEGNFTRIAAPAESIHNDLLYSSYLEIIEVELCGGPSCNILLVVVGEVGCPTRIVLWVHRVLALPMPSLSCNKNIICNMWLLVVWLKENNAILPQKKVNNMTKHRITLISVPQLESRLSAGLSNCCDSTIIPPPGLMSQHVLLWSRYILCPTSATHS